MRPLPLRGCLVIIEGLLPITQTRTYTQRILSLLLCTDSHPNTIVTRRTSPLRSDKLYIRNDIYRFARLPVFKRCSCNTSARRQHQRRGGLIALCRKPRLQRRLSRNAAYKRKHGQRERPDRCLYKITSVYL